MPHNTIQRTVTALCKGKKKTKKWKKKVSVSQTQSSELTDPSWKDSPSCEGDTLLCLSFLRLYHGEIGTRDFCLSNLSEQDIRLVLFSCQLSQGNSWLICFNGYSLPSPADSSLSHCAPRAVAGKLQNLADKHPLWLSYYFTCCCPPDTPEPQLVSRRAPGGHREVVWWETKQVISSPGWCMRVGDKQLVVQMSRE